MFWRKNWAPCLLVQSVISVVSTQIGTFEKIETAWLSKPFQSSLFTFWIWQNNKILNWRSMIWRIFAEETKKKVQNCAWSWTFKESVKEEQVRRYLQNHLFATEKTNHYGSIYYLAHVIEKPNLRILNPQYLQLFF